MPPSFQMKVWWGQKCSFSLSLFVLTQLQTTLKTTMAACSSIPTRILLPLGAMSQLQQLSSSSNRLSQDKEPRRMPTFILSLPHLSFQMLMKARKIPRNSPSGDSAVFPALDQLPNPVHPGGGKFRSGNVLSTEFPRKGDASKQLTGNIPWATVTLLCNS